MNTDSFVYQIEIEDFYCDIAKDVETKFYTSRYSKNNNNRGFRGFEYALW